MSPVVYVGPQSRALALASETPDAVSVLAVETPDAALLADARVTAVVVDPDAAVDANCVRDVEAPLLTTSGSPLPDAVVDERVAAEGDPIPVLADRLAALVDAAPARRERALRRQNERLDRFAGVVSHDLQTPIQLALTQLELYRETGDEAHLDRLADAHERMQRLLDDLLALARRGESVAETRPVSLSSLAADAWHGIDSGDARLQVDDDATLAADPGRLDQLLTNLFVNSVEHATSAPSGGVTITVGLLPEGGFYVADDGPGIPPAEHEQVFERGYTTSADGTGFGLAIAAEVAEAHGWSIGVTESESGGARFEITGVSSLAPV